MSALQRELEILQEEPKDPRYASDWMQTLYLAFDIHFSKGFFSLLLEQTSDLAGH